MEYWLGRRPHVPVRHFCKVGALIVLLLCLGCERQIAGPAQLYIQTGDRIVEDFVIRPAENFSTLHSGYSNLKAGQIVATGELIELPLSDDYAQNLTSFSVTATHPAYRYEWTAVSLPSQGGPFLLPTIQATLWADYLKEHEIVDYTTIIDHLHRTYENWLPTIGVGGGERIGQYLPELDNLVAHAQMTEKDKSFFASEKEAQTRMLYLLESIRAITQ